MSWMSSVSAADDGRRHRAERGVAESSSSCAADGVVDRPAHALRGRRAEAAPPSPRHRRSRRCRRSSARPIRGSRPARPGTSSPAGRRRSGRSGGCRRRRRRRTGARTRDRDRGRARPACPAPSNGAERALRRQRRAGDRARQELLRARRDHPLAHERRHPRALRRFEGEAEPRAEQAAVFEDVAVAGVARAVIELEPRRRRASGRSAKTRRRSGCRRASPRARRVAALVILGAVRQTRRCRRAPGRPSRRTIRRRSTRRDPLRSSPRAPVQSPAGVGEPSAK